MGLKIFKIVAIYPKGKEKRGRYIKKRDRCVYRYGKVEVYSEF